MKKLLSAVLGYLALVMVMSANAFAVWPPSTAFQQDIQPTLFGYIVVALVIGIAIGVWSQRSRHEHK